MLPEFHNKPCVNLRGSTWDVRHLDKFLASPWGDKLFRSKMPSENCSVPEQLPLMSSNSSIRPSAAFLSLTRENPPLQQLDKTKGNPLMHSSTNPYTAPVLNKEVVKLQLEKIEKQRTVDLKEYMKVIPPSKRKQLFEAEKIRNLRYLSLKHDKIRETKKQRILSGEYRSGVLGVEQPRETKNTASAREKLRTENIRFHTRASTNIQFFNEKAGEEIREKPRGLKKVEAIPEHYHDTFNTLFVKNEEKRNEDRENRLQYLWRGCRDFNIISGVLF